MQETVSLNRELCNEVCSDTPSGIESDGMGRQSRQVGAFTQAIAAELQRKRERRNLTLEQLSDNSGVAYSTLGKLLNGQTAIDTDQLFALCGALGVDPRDLVELAESHAFKKSA